MTTTPQPVLALIHTSFTLVPMFTELCKKHLPEVRIFHITDDSLIQDTVRHGALRRITMRRLIDQVASAEAAGADAVLTTCSSIGEGVALAQKLFDIPVIRIDEAMAEAVVAQAKTVGVLATLRTTLEPTTNLLRQKAAEAGREVRLIECLCEDAFPAVLAGDVETHDRLLRQALLNDMKGVDAIVLAQASMSRVVNSLEPGLLQAPVFSSPELAVKSVRAKLGLPVLAGK